LKAVVVLQDTRASWFVIKTGPAKSCAIALVAQRYARDAGTFLYFSISYFEWLRIAMKEASAASMACKLEAWSQQLMLRASDI
jgi:hypothetical protein